MKQFNFLPKYKNWILEGKKFRTVRYGDKYYKKFRVGDRVTITICDNVTSNYDLKNAQKIADGEILELVFKKIKDIKQEDVVGDPEAWPKSSLISGLSEIYSKRIGRKVNENDFVTIVKFRVIK
jgi:hypothetical protein